MDKSKWFSHLILLSRIKSKDKSKVAYLEAPETTGGGWFIPMKFMEINNP
jgi:hypothetical protein